jgi:RNA polymerase sigma-70 factor, ECF subfamily
MPAQPRAEADLLGAVRELQAGTRMEANSRRIFERYYRWVRGFFSRRGYSPEDAEDLAQETFLKLFREIASFRGDDSFQSWLFAVAANLHRNEQRRRRSRKRDAPEVAFDDSVGGAAPPLRDPSGSEVSPARSTFERERQAALERAIRTLPPQMRQCLELLLGQDLKYRQIAALLKVSVETVKAHLFQARRRLRTELGEEYGRWSE